MIDFEALKVIIAIIAIILTAAGLITAVTLPILTGLIGLVWFDMRRRVDSKPDQGVCNAVHHNIDRQLNEFTNDIPRIFITLDDMNVKITKVTSCLEALCSTAPEISNGPNKSLIQRILR